MKRFLKPAVAAAILFCGFFPAEADEAVFDLGIESAYVWRGITMEDKAVLQPSMSLTIRSFRVCAWGNVNLDDYDRIQNHGLFYETDITLSYLFTVNGINCDAGWIEYIFPESSGNTREIYGRARWLFQRGLYSEAELYFDVDEAKDIYARGSAGWVVDLGESLEVDLGCSASIAGSDMSGGDHGGFHDYSFSLRLTHGADTLRRLYAHITYTDTLDRDVLPEQEVDVYAGAGISLLF